MYRLSLYLVLVRHLAYMDVGNAACTAKYIMLTVTWCCSEYCVPSGLNFQVSGGSFVRYYLSSYLL